MATMGPPPYNVEAVMLWSIGSVCSAGVVAAAAAKIFVVRRMRTSADAVPSPRLAVATGAEGLLLIAALYLLQIPVETDATTVAALLAFFFTGAALVNWVALRTEPVRGGSRRLGQVLLVTLIFPVIQTMVAVTIGPPLSAWFIKLFP